MPETGRDEADLQNEIVPDADEITDDQLYTDDCEGFLDLGFIAQVVVPTVPLNLNPRKRKASSLRRAHDAEVGSYVVGYPSAPPPSKRSKLIFYLNDLAKI
ncbi:unnamed protein product [Lactuca saligna]|uniref:Uncharacterized protein n=1 Tax=Lactuca saligna TaxID=75948 RepID=A0AA35YZ08_LACSI|nr:unnamed protein product [Lactuca saligna]